MPVVNGAAVRLTSHYSQLLKQLNHVLIYLRSLFPTVIVVEDRKPIPKTFLPPFQQRPSIAYKILVGLQGP